MAAEITNYQCPGCSGPLHFSGSSGKLECDYCGSTYDVAEIEALYAEKQQKAEQAFSSNAAEPEKEGEEDWNDEDLTSDWGREEEKMRAYLCPSCGAELICDQNTAATSCPYCGNPTVVPGQFAGTLRPDYVIPFRLDRNEAKAALKKFYHGKILLPAAFKQENRLNKLQGLYVPFWLYDGAADVQAQFAATRTNTRRSGDYDITDTRHYTVQRGGRVIFEKIPVDASSKMPDAYMDAIEPFDYQQLRPFSNAYLPGFLADRYDVSSKDSAARADKRAANSAVDAMQADVIGYHTCTTVSQRVKLHRGKVHYAMLPVYMLNTRWKGKSYLFAMNGQTGKMIGNLPVSAGKCCALFAGVALPLTAVISAILYAFW